jgi:hypothetical protein
MKGDYKASKPKAGSKVIAGSDLSSARSGKWGSSATHRILGPDGKMRTRIDSRIVEDAAKRSSPKKPRSSDAG